MILKFNKIKVNYNLIYFFFAAHYCAQWYEILSEIVWFRSTWTFKRPLPWVDKRGLLADSPPPLLVHEVVE